MTLNRRSFLVGGAASTAASISTFAHAANPCSTPTTWDKTYDVIVIGSGIEDSPQLHTKQTMAAGDFRADPALVATLCENVPQSVEWLKKVGVQFKPGIYQIYGGL